MEGKKCFLLPIETAKRQKNYLSHVKNYFLFLAVNVSEAILKILHFTFGTIVAFKFNTYAKILRDNELKCVKMKGLATRIWYYYLFI